MIDEEEDDFSIDIDLHEGVCGDCNMVYWIPAGCGECRLTNEGR